MIAEKELTHHQVTEEAKLPDDLLRLQKFVIFYQNVIIPDARNRRIPLFSSFGELPSVTIPQFHGVLSDLRNSHPLQKPTFLDCGSGDGMMVALATIVGFKALGIELDQKLVSLSRRYLQQLRMLGIVSSNTNTRIAHGSYYLPNASPDLKKDLIEELMRRFKQEEILDTVSFEEYVRTLFSSNGKRKSYLETLDTILGRRTNVYQKLGVPINQNYVVYHYSSDLVSPLGFLPQMAQLLKTGSRVILFQTGNFEKAQHNGFTTEQIIPINNPEICSASLSILIKT